MNQNEHLKALRPALEQRAQIMSALRVWFEAEHFLEIEAPVHLRAPAPEDHIEAIPTDSGWLRTSPELDMKKLLAAGYERIWHAGPCFRAGERGPLHRPEYTMLEWYRADAGYRQILNDTQRLLRHIEQQAATPRQPFSRKWIEIPVSEAFLTHAGWDPAQDWDENRFDLDLVEKVEPALPCNQPVVLMDYPAPAAALARLKPNDPLRAERWELFYNGIELANAYGELVDATEQRQRFEACNLRSQADGRPAYPLDEDFLQALQHCPPCTGIALGIDRLVMVLLGLKTIDEVRL